MRTSIPLKCQPAPGQTLRKLLPLFVQTPLAALTVAAVLLAIQSCARTPASPKPATPAAKSPATTAVTTIAKPAAPTPATPAAQTPVKTAASKPAHKPAHQHKRPSAAHSITPPVQAPVTPPTPEPPHWPVNDRPAEASVTWDSHGLLINAQNSSLKQILNDVAAATGAQVEGLGADQRIYGAYGPGKARDVLSQLLDGCGYNVLMIGDQGEGTPRQIVLSSRGGANTQTAANPAQPPAVEEESEAEEQPDADSNPRRPNRHGPNDPGGPPRTPQQMQMDQRNNPPPPP